MTSFQILVPVTIACVLTSIVVNANGDQTRTSKDLNGAYLLGLGKKYDKPLLRLLGKTMNNLEETVECSYGGCNQWSAWSNCPVGFGQFGMKVRTRQCSLDATTCEKLTSNRTETDSQLCERLCPETYNVTKNGFCLRFVSTHVSKSTAKSACQADGGYVVNVNSAEKFDDIAELTKHYSAGSGRWMDGERTSATSSWTFSYETHLTWSLGWNPSGEPHNGTNDLCAVFTISPNTKYDLRCSSSYAYVCEIIP